MKKKLMSVLLVAGLLLGGTFSSLAASEQESVYNKIEEVYQIPREIIETLSPEMINDLAECIMDDPVYVSNDTYVKLTVDDDGNAIAEESTLIEYLQSQKQRDSFEDTTSWMKLRTTIIEKNSSEAQISVGCTFLTIPKTFRGTDYVALTVTNCNFVPQSYSGFYSCTNTAGIEREYFTYSDFKPNNSSMYIKYDLADSIYEVTNDYAFIQADIFKEGNSGAVYSTYANQTVKMSFTPNISFDTSGHMSFGTLNINNYYRQAPGYAAMAWTK